MARRATRLFGTIVLIAGLTPLRAGVSQTLSDSLRHDLDDWYRHASRRAPGEWGIAIANQQGQLLWSIHPWASLQPASTVKLFTTGFARSVLGNDARKVTRVVGSGYIEPANGEWMGPWALELNGDPSLENPEGTGPRLADLARQLADLGIRKISGPLEVRSADGPADATYPSVWSRRHRGRLFAPLVGMLTLHENVVWFTLSPGAKIGVRGEMSDDAPRGIGSMVANYTRTVSGRRARLRLSPLAGGGWTVSGTIGINAWPRSLATVVSNPKLVLEQVWDAALRDVGIAWNRASRRARMAISVPVTLAAVESPVLDSLASEVNRRSLNLGAELLLRWAGPEAGPARLEQHVREISGTEDGLHLVDGSGLSYEDRATPMTFISYLARLPATDAGRNFPLLLPANGVGTLRHLNSGLPAQGVVRAKTGTLGNASTISGYLGRPDGVFIVSVMYNGSRPTAAREHQWDLFRLLGADGTIIPADPAGTDGTQMGGETSTPEHPNP